MRNSKTIPEHIKQKYRENIKKHIVDTEHESTFKFYDYFFKRRKKFGDVFLNGNFVGVALNDREFITVIQNNI